MATRKVKGALLIPLLGLATVLAGHSAMACMEEVVVVGSRPTAESQDAAVFQEELHEYMRSVNEAIKAKLEAKLEAELEPTSRPRIRIAAAEIQVRG